jgi:hypothetical protein
VLSEAIQRPASNVRQWWPSTAASNVRRALDEADQRAHRESHAALGEVATNPVERGE